MDLTGEHDAAGGAGVHHDGEVAEERGRGRRGRGGRLRGGGGGGGIGLDRFGFHAATVRGGGGETEKREKSLRSSAEGAEARRHGGGKEKRQGACIVKIRGPSARLFDSGSGPRIRTITKAPADINLNTSHPDPLGRLWLTRQTIKRSST